MHLNWTDMAIAAKLRSSQGFVRKRKRELSEMPYRLFHMPGALRQTVRYIRQVWECGFCRSLMATTEAKVRRRVALHVYSPTAIAYYGLTDGAVEFPEQSDASKALGVRARARIERAASGGKRPK